MTRLIVVVSAGIGAGHDGAAAELAKRLGQLGYRIERYDFLELLSGPAGRSMRWAYATQLRVAPRSWGWLLRVLQRYPALAELGVMAWTPGSQRRMRAVLGARPAAVVSTFPLASHALGRLRRRGGLAVPVITYLTDLSVHPLWIWAGVDAHVALHRVAAEAAARLGGRMPRVARPAVSARFRPVTSTAEQRAAREQFGLPAQAPLALVVAGSWGIGEIEQTVDDIHACGITRAVVACGRNDALRQRLQARGEAIALGWTEEMPTLVRACDVVVQNAGGLSCLESLASGVPVVSYRCVPGHGQMNAAALDEAGWAVWARSRDDLGTALKRAVAREERVPDIARADEPAALIDALVDALVTPAGTDHAA